MPDELLARITLIPGKRSGHPCVRDTRIAVHDVLGYLAGGMTVAEILADWPDLSPEDIRACCAYGAALAERVVAPTPREPHPLIAAARKQVERGQ